VPPLLCRASPCPEARGPQAPAPDPRSPESILSPSLFADRERADQLVDTLTQAGLPACSGPVPACACQQVQQIVLGPFQPPDAAADRAAFSNCGGYGDAR
jgi:hypothetical protein